MRFKKGSKVEVMNKKEVPMSWSSAEIMYGNGHTYTVRYDVFPGSKTEAVVERVSRKTIRPCPPPVEGVESWVVGDIVEVFHDISWKIATVLKVYGVNYYLVRLFGISEEFRVHRTSVRVRQSWKDDTWVVMGKDSRCSGDVKSNELSNSNCNQKVNFEVPRANMKIKPQPGYDSFAVQHNTRLQESHIASSRSLKRASPYCSSLLEAQTGNYKKTRAIEKEGRRERAGHTPLPEKVDAVAYPREIMCVYTHTSYNNISNGYYEMERTSSSEPKEYDNSDASSVGSCSISSESPCKFPSRLLEIPCPVRETDCCSDAESFYGSGNEDNCPFPREEEVEASIHSLELHAFRCTLGALYASGPLSWEQEELLTNLRITLHISNDEHLMEVRSLISSRSGINISYS